jgi:hypothetical protein
MNVVCNAATVGQFNSTGFTGNSATATYAPLTIGASTSLSGATAPFTGIPSWVTRVTLLIQGAVTGGTGVPAIVMGVSTYEVSGYSSVINNIGASSVSSGASATSSWDLVTTGSPSNTYTGQIVITKSSGYVYNIVSQIGNSTSSATFSTGSKNFSGVVNQLQLCMSSGADTFVSGNISIMWE